MTPRFRFAPDPSDAANVRNLRTAAFNWALSRAMRGDFVIRVEDGGAAAGVTGSVPRLLDALTWLGVDWDEGPDVGGDYGPYVRSERRPLHQRAIEQLLAGGHAYYEEVSGQSPLRLRLPDSGQTIVDDAIRGAIAFDNETVDDPVIADSDGRPTPYLATVVDDHEMNITHVVRGDEQMDTAPLYVQFYQIMGWEEPTWVHLPPILHQHDSELLKAGVDGDYLVPDLQASGYLAPAVLNYLLLLGWSPDRDIVTRWDIRQQFRLERLSAGPAIFDWDKLKWVNRQYISQLSDAELAQQVQPFLEEAYGEMPMSSAWLKRLTSLIREQLDTLEDAVDAAEWAFVDDFEYNDSARQALASEPARPVLIRLVAEIAAVVLLDEQTAHRIIQNLGTGYQASHGWKPEEVSRPIQAALTGRSAGPLLPEVMAIVGQARTLQRLAAALKRQ